MAIFAVLLVWAHTWCLLKADDVNSQAFVPYSSLMVVKWLTRVKKLYIFFILFYFFELCLTGASSPRWFGA